MPQGFNPTPSSIQITRMLRRPPPMKVGFNPTVHNPAAPHLGAPHMAPIPKAPRVGRMGFQAGGLIDNPFHPVTGPIVTASGGRADEEPVHVPKGSYVLPADVVAAVGDGNSIAGMNFLSKIFLPPGKLYVAQGQGLPGGAQSPPMHVGRGMGIPEPQKTQVSGFPQFKIGYPSYVGTQQGPAPQAHGGVVPGEGGSNFLNRMGVGVSAPGTPINISGGEFVVPREEVMRRGKGNLQRGHEALDAFVKQTRAQHIATLKKLPGPAK